jgi:hypothetical protein
MTLTTLNNFCHLNKCEYQIAILAINPVGAGNEGNCCEGGNSTSRKILCGLLRKHKKFLPFHNAHEKKAKWQSSIEHGKDYFPLYRKHCDHAI